jgi:hypothetical protein
LPSFPGSASGAAGVGLAAAAAAGGGIAAAGAAAGAGAFLHHSARLTSSASWQWLSSVPSLFDFARLPLKQPDALPRQDNACDCGLFALQYVEALCRPLLPHVTAEHLASRARMRTLFGEDFFLHAGEEMAAGTEAGTVSLERKRDELRRLILADIARRKECVPPPGYKQAL